MSPTTTGFFILALIVGAAAGAYLPLNGRFADQIGSPLLATAVFFSVGAATAWAAAMVFGPPDFSRLGAADAPLFALGAVSFTIILCATVLIPKLGAGAYFVCLVAGQVGVGLLLSHFGWLASDRLPMTPLKAVGALLLIAAVLIIRHEEAGQRAAAAPVERQDRA